MDDFYQSPDRLPDLDGIKEDYDSLHRELSVQATKRGMTIGAYLAMKEKEAEIDDSYLFGNVF